jgi:hypothetical protein
MLATKKASKEAKAIQGIPTIEVKLRTLHESFEALKTLAMTPVRAFISFRLSKIVRQVREEIKSSQESRQEVLERVANLLEGEMAWKFETPEKKKEFEEEMNKLLEEKVIINGSLFKISELKAADGTEITIEAAALELLDWLIIEG